MTKNKCIAVFGGTGKVGCEFAKMALESGYSLRLLVRNRSSFDLDNDNRIEVIEGDATNAKDVAAVVAGSDVVVSTLGNPYPSRGVHIMFNATENIMKAAAKQPNPPAISRLEHGLQSATRAWREGANDDSFQSLLGLAALTTSDFCEPRLIGHHFYCR